MYRRKRAGPKTDPCASGVSRVGLKRGFQKSQLYVTGEGRCQ